MLLETVAETMIESTQPSAPKRGGAPLQNANRLRSGKRAWASVKRLPAKCGSIRRALYKERDEIEEATVARHGEISLYHAALIQSAIRHSGRSQLLERWLRVEPDLSLAERLAVLREIGNASDSRDKCLQRLQLDSRPDHDAWRSLRHVIGGPGDQGDLALEETGYTDEDAEYAEFLRQKALRDIASDHSTS